MVSLSNILKNRVYDLCTLNGDHKGYTVAASESDALPNGGENDTAGDIFDLCNVDDIRETLKEERIYASDLLFSVEELFAKHFSPDTYVLHKMGEYPHATEYLVTLKGSGMLFSFSVNKKYGLFGVYTCGGAYFSAPYQVKQWGEFLQDLEDAQTFINTFFAE